VVRATVPETAVKEDSHLCWTKNDVRSPAQPRNRRGVHPVSVSTSMQKSAHSYFVLGVSGPLELHAASYTGI
jgi:hypothetical protein